LKNGNIPSCRGKKSCSEMEITNMIDEFHVMYMYKKIQAEAATTDMKTLEQLLKKFRQVVAERREEYYQEIGEKKAQKLRAKRLQQLIEKMGRDRVSPEDLIGQ